MTAPVISAGDLVAGKNGTTQMITNPIRAKATGRLVGHAANVNFDTIAEPDLARWIDALPLDEFGALIDAHAAGAILDPSLALPVEPLEPHGDDWLPCDEQPASDDDLVWVMFLDGEVMGPNRASAFLWGADQGAASIIAYAPAVPGTVLNQDGGKP